MNWAALRPAVMKAVVSLVEFGRLAHQIAVERAAQALVRADQNDGALPHLTDFGKRMRQVAGMGGHLGQHLAHERGVGPPGQCGLLGLAHLRRRHHLHRLGNLGGVLDRLDASAYVARAGHVNYQALERLSIR